MICRYSRLGCALFLTVPLLAACSGTPQNADDPSVVSPQDTGAQTEETHGSEAKGETSNSPPPESGGLNSAQREQMELVLKRGGKKAEQCAESVPDGKGGEGEVKVLFDGRKGRIVEVTVGTPWAGTSMESCIQRSFVGEIVLPFDGDPLEVPYTVKVPEKKCAAVDPKKPGKKP